MCSGGLPFLIEVRLVFSQLGLLQGVRLGEQGWQWVVGGGHRTAEDRDGGGIALGDQGLSVSVLSVSFFVCKSWGKVLVSGC